MAMSLSRQTGTSRSTAVPRSILKKSTLQAPPAFDQEQRNRDTAIYHANLLQQRKDAEFLILSSTEELLDLPSSPHADPANPSARDAQLVRELLKPFQQSDHNGLIAERNINRQCGYVLCPNPNKVEDSKAKFRILRDQTQGPNGLKFVEKEYLEKWCSDECGKRALYIQVQLSEEPAWTRGTGDSQEIILLEEGGNVDEGMKHSNGGTHTSSLDEAQEQMVQRLESLSIERGHKEVPDHLLKPANISVHEKPHSMGEPRPPSLTHNDSINGALMVEGYRPKQSIRGGNQNTTEDNDADDFIETI